MKLLNLYGQLDKISDKFSSLFIFIAIAITVGKFVLVLS